jgi:sulfonate transport system ATP-binding protein
MAPNEMSDRGFFRALDAAPESWAETRHAAAPAGRTGLEVRLDGVGKSFGEHKVLDALSLAIEPGEFLAIVGHSGCGKSTLLRLVAGLDTATEGSISVGGKRLATPVPEARIMFQDARLLPWRRVIDNVGIGQKGAWRPAARAALRAVGLDGRSGDWPALLSGGQRQRVALARALVSRPRLLLLDEPLGALDALTRLDMQELIEDVWRAQGFTALLVTHDVGEAVALADRVIVLQDGAISLERRLEHPRPRPRGDAELAAIEGEILGHLMRRGRATVPPSANR